MSDHPAPRLVASDLDGTLVGGDGHVSARNREAIARVEAAGALFVMVTGRPPRWMAAVSEETAHRGLAVCANGALLYDLHTERVVEGFLLDETTAARVVLALREQLPGITFAVERGEGGFGREQAYRARWENEGVEVGEIDVLVQGGVVKLLGRVEGTGSDDLLDAARDVLGDAATLTHSSDNGLLEISASGVSKASGLAALAAERGIGPGEAVAFGDMPNDLPMLEWAGLGVAMANAHPLVLAAADEVTGSNDEDGVAQVLERWF